MSLTRRAFGAGLAVLAAGAARGATAYADAVLRRMAALPAGPVLLHSYIVEPGGGDFDLTQADAAYVYDNALAGLLLLAAGHRDEAARIGQALALAQAHDRKFTDGRLRNCYAAGAMATPAKLAGFWDAKDARWAEDPYQVSTDSGPMAWAMLLWLALDMREPAGRAADFLNARLRAPRGYYGGLFGFDPSQQLLTWQSTEQNTDLAVSFRLLGRAQDADHARAFVQAMFDVNFQRFDSGCGPDGAVNHLCAADAGIWPYLAGLGSAHSALVAIRELQRGNGIGFADASQGIWLEGTSFAALALRDMGNPLAPSFMATIAANLAPQGYVYATVAPKLDTGLSVGPALQKGGAQMPFTYIRRPSLSATSWAGLAQLNANPLAP